MLALWRFGPSTEQLRRCFHSAQFKESYSAFMGRVHRLSMRWVESAKVHTFHDFLELIVKEQIFKVIFQEHATLAHAQRSENIQILAETLDEIAAANKPLHSKLPGHVKSVMDRLYLPPWQLRAEELQQRPPVPALRQHPPVHIGAHDQDCRRSISSMPAAPIHYQPTDIPRSDMTQFYIWFTALP